MNSVNEWKGRHIAMYIGSLQKGGAERVMVNLAEYFHEQGYRVTFVTTYLSRVEYEVPDAAWKVLETGQEPQEQELCRPDPAQKQKTDVQRVLTVAGDYATVSFNNRELQAGQAEKPKACCSYIGRVFSAPLLEELTGSRIGNFRTRCKRLRSIWKTLAPDLILSFSGKNNVMAIMTSFGLGIPVVVSVRSNPSREYANRLLRMAMLSTFRHAAGVVLQTDGAMQYFPKVVQKKSVILPNSIHPDFIREPFQGVRDKTVVSVGRLDDNKNQALLIKAFAKISQQQQPSYTLHLYGDGPCRGKLEKLAEDLNVQDKVFLEGIVDKVADRIMQAGIFVLSSDQEGMPNALIEAMSLGIPCIATDCPCGGPKDLIRDARSDSAYGNGLLTPVGNVDKMAESLLYLMTDQGRAAQIGMRAARVQKQYSPEAINARWKEYLDSLMV